MGRILLSSKLSESKTHRCGTSKGHLVQNRWEYGMIILCGQKKKEKKIGRKFTNMLKWWSWVLCMISLLPFYLFQIFSYTGELGFRNLIFKFKKHQGVA